MHLARIALSTCGRRGAVSIKSAESGPWERAVAGFASCEPGSFGETGELLKAIPYALCVTSTVQLTMLDVGYLGVPHAACMAELGFEVLAGASDGGRIRELFAGALPFVEPALSPYCIADWTPDGFPLRVPTRRRQISEMCILCGLARRSARTLPARICLSCTCALRHLVRRWSVRALPWASPLCRSTQPQLWPVNWFGWRRSATPRKLPENRSFCVKGVL